MNQEESAPAVTSAVDSSVTALLQSVQAIRGRHSQARAANTSDHAPEFNVFDFFGHREVLLSRVIAWMLDPNETHREGTKFLRAFLEKFTPARRDYPLDEERLRAAVITREAMTSGISADECGRYIDVLIELPGGETVAVENKLTGTAPWMERQLRCYHAHIAQRAGSAPHSVVALIGWNTDAQAEVKRHWGADLSNDGSVRGFDRGHVADWAAHCASASQAPAVKHFLQSFDKFMDKSDEQGGSVRQTAEIVDLLTRDSDSLASALAISTALPLAKERLVQAMIEEFRRAVDEKQGWEISQTDRDSMITAHMGGTGFHIRYRNGPPLIFSLIFHNCDLQSPYWGVRAADNVVGYDEMGLKRGIDKALGKIGHGPDRNWVWWSWENAISDVWSTKQEKGLVKRFLEEAASLEQGLPELLSAKSPL